MFDAKTRAILETENAEQMFVGRRSMEIEQVASFGNIQIAPAVSAPQTQAFSGISSQTKGSASRETSDGVRRHGRG